MSTPEKKDSAPTKKPDGSAWKAHMEGITKRNAEAQKAGLKRRQEHEQEQAVSRRAYELRQAADLHSKGVPRGKSEAR